MPRFFIDPNAVGEGEIVITGADAHHIARSLRMAVGEVITVADGTGAEYTARLTRIRDEECLCEITEKSESAAEPKRPITLYMAYPKGDKMETVVQKAVELGASRIVPFESERCIKRPSPEKADKQTARLTRIAEEAAKQCGRAVLPTVDRPITLDALLKRIPQHCLTLFCYEGKARSLKAVLTEKAEAAENIAVIVGSEGGFSAAEAERITAAGAECVNLGPRILRCETAPDYVLSALSYFLEL